ncbi:MAG: alpha/beta fold hydrolase [Pseudomonadota bacterium]|jgi:pimeloyl-ACP methyl ester carboxylesterase
MERQSWLLLHGAGGGGWEWAIWDRVLRALGGVVAAPDLVAGARGLAATTLDDYRTQAAAAARAADRAPVLVGASLGGLLALQVAAAAPLRALVLVNPLPPAPWHGLLPPRDASPALVPWGRNASLLSTRRALPDASDATCEWAWRRWRDESGAVVDAARAGIEVARPRCPVLVIASEADDDVPVAASAALAQAWAASLWRLPGTSHVGPLLGRGAASCAARVAAWVDSLPPP